MTSFDETPRSNRIRIAFFGLRNAGKSTLVNAFCGQSLSIVSDVPGTTTDPVSKAMEILPLGPCMVTDTAGLDDEGGLGEQRVRKSLDVLATADIAVWAATDDPLKSAAERRWKERFLSECGKHGVKVFEYRRGEDVGGLKSRIAAVKLDERTAGLLDGIVKPGELVICVCPIDASAPKGRLILPQVQVIRECLDLHTTCIVVQPEELSAAIEKTDGKHERVLVITDSQAVSKVEEIIGLQPSVLNLRLTTFSVLFARQKGDFAEFVRGIEAIKSLKDGDTVLISEACTHRRHCEDIGVSKIPKAVMALSGCQKFNFAFSSGATFNPATMRSLGTHAALIVHCGGCMLTRRELLHRIDLARAAAVPIVNYGLVLSAAAGLSEFGADGLVSDFRRKTARQ